MTCSRSVRYPAKAGFNPGSLVPRLGSYLTLVLPPPSQELRARCSQESSPLGCTPAGSCPHGPGDGLSRSRTDVSLQTRGKRSSPLTVCILTSTAGEAWPGQGTSETNFWPSLLPHLPRGSWPRCVISEVQGPLLGGGTAPSQAVQGFTLAGPSRMLKEETIFHSRWPTGGE